MNLQITAALLITINLIITIIMIIIDIIIIHRLTEENEKEIKNDDYYHTKLKQTDYYKYYCHKKPKLSISKTTDCDSFAPKPTHKEMNSHMNHNTLVPKPTPCDIDGPQTTNPSKINFDAFIEQLAQRITPEEINELLTITQDYLKNYYKEHRTQSKHIMNMFARTINTHSGYTFTIDNFNILSLTYKCGPTNTEPVCTIYTNITTKELNDLKHCKLTIRQLLNSIQTLSVANHETQTITRRNVEVLKDLLPALDDQHYPFA